MTGGDNQLKILGNLRLLSMLTISVSACGIVGPGEESPTLTMFSVQVVSPLLRKRGSKNALV